MRRRSLDDVADGDRNGKRLRGGGRLEAQERRLQRDPLGFRETAQRLVIDDVAEQVVQGSERKTGLDLGGTGSDDPVAALLCQFDRPLPDRRLADPRGTGDEQDAETLGHPIEDTLDRRQLAVSSYERLRHQGTPPSVVPVARSEASLGAVERALDRALTGASCAASIVRVIARPRSCHQLVAVGTGQRPLPAVVRLV